MALRLRRGTDAQRALITPAEGELIYTTDTKDLYVGDGSTLGGILVTSAVNFIDDLQDVDTTTVAPVSDQALVWGGSKWVPGTVASNIDDLGGVNTTGATVGQVLKYNGTTWVPDDDASPATVNLGDLADVNFAEDSTVPGDGEVLSYSLTNGDWRPTQVFTSLSQDPTPSLGGSLDLAGRAIIGNGNINITGDVGINGFLDVNGGLSNSLNLNGNLILGAGQINIQGDVKANALQGSLYADDSTIIVDAETGTMDWARLVNTPTTLSGYGITDAFSSNGGDINGNVSLQDFNLTNVNRLTVGFRITTNEFFGTYGEFSQELGAELFRGPLVGDVTGSIYGQDSSIAYDSNIGQFYGNLTGNVTGDTTGTHRGLQIGAVVGDVVGSVFADDSSVIVDGLNGTINTSTIRPTAANETLFTTSGDRLRLRIERTDTVDASTNPNYILGNVMFSRNDPVNGVVNLGQIVSTNAGIAIIHDTDGTFADTTEYLAWGGGKLGVGKTSGSHTVDVNGGVAVENYVYYKPITAATRDGLTAAIGMVVYNSDAGKLQVCTGLGPTVWTDLH